MLKRPQKSSQKHPQRKYQLLIEPSLLQVVYNFVTAYQKNKQINRKVSTQTSTKEPQEHPQNFVSYT